MRGCNTCIIVNPESFALYLLKWLYIVKMEFTSQTSISFAVFFTIKESMTVYLHA